MRRIVVSGAIAAMLAASGASDASRTPQQIVFGRSGGNIAPFRVTIEPSGHVRHTGFVGPRRHRLSRAKAASLSRLVRQGFARGLASRLCAGTNSDIGSDFIRDSVRTITVHGTCEPGFTKLWDTLARAVGLRFG